jgi:hypothetical protein
MARNAVDREGQATASDESFTHSQTFPDQPGSRAVVFWLEPNGRIGRGSPMPVPLAEEMRLEYARRYPERRYWLQESPSPVA